MHLHQSIRSSFPKFLFHQKRLFAQKLTRINYSQLNKMNDTLPVKQEIDDKHLADESAILHPYISQCYTLYEKKQLQPYDFAGIFILLYCSLRRPKSWSNGQLDLALSINEQELSKENSIKLIKIPYLIESLDINYLSRKLGIPQDSLQFQSLTVADIFSKLQLAGIKKNTDHFINRSIVQWALNRRPFHLMFEIPSPMTVLLQQSRGQRVVTMFRHKHELSTTHVAQLHYMEGSQNHARDAFEFLIHDLKHMENFILADSHVEQVGFFKCMLRLGNGHPRNFFEEICGYDEKLWNELEYVISDM